MAATVERATDIYLRIVAEQAEEKLACRSAWLDAQQRHALQLELAAGMGSAYAAYRRQLAETLRT